MGKCICDWQLDGIGGSMPYERPQESMALDEETGEWMYLVRCDVVWRIAVTFEGGSPASYGPVRFCPLCGREL